MTQQAAPAHTPSGGAPRSVGPRVLVIDDSITILKVVSIILAGNGYDVSVARDGSEGFEQLQAKGPFDLVLLDFVMPRMNGYQFCRQLRADAQHRNLPVVLMSARTNTIGDRFVEQTGAVDALSKPFDARALVAVVGNVLSKQQQVSPEARKSMPNPDTMVDETELSVDVAPAGPPSQHFRSLDEMSASIVEAIAPAISRMRSQDVSVQDLVESTIAKCLTPQLLIELAKTAADLDLEEGGSKEILRGGLSKMPLAEVMQMLQLRRQTGVMVVTDKTMKLRARFYLRNGMLDFGEAEGLEDEFRLGRYFVEPGWITREAIDDALEDRPVGKVMGEWLLEKELVTPQQLDHALARQSAELVYEVLRWDEGRFILYDDEFTGEAERARLELGLSELVLEGFRRVDEWRLMADTINFDAVLVVDQVALGNIDEAKIGKSEQTVLSGIDGKRTAREVMEQIDLASFDAIKSIYGFLQSRIVREVTPKTRTESVTKMAAVSNEELAEAERASQEEQPSEAEQAAEAEAAEAQEKDTIAPPDEETSMPDEPTSIDEPAPEATSDAS